MPSRDVNGRNVLNGGGSSGSRMSRTSAEDYCSTTSGDDSPSERPERVRKPRSSSSRGQHQSHSSAFSATPSRSNNNVQQAFPFPLNPAVQMASASAGFNFHTPLAINSLTNSGRYSFDSLTGSCENGNWRPGSGGQIPNPLWFPSAHQFAAMNPYFSFAPCYGATPNNYVEAMRHMMPPGENPILNGVHTSAADKNSRSSSPRNRKRALSTSPESDMMSLVSEFIRSTSGSLATVGLHGDLSSRCSSSTSRGSFSHLSAGTISPTALYACRPPFFAQNMHNFGVKMPSGSTTPVMPPMYPYHPFMLMSPFANPKPPEQMPNGSFGANPIAQHPSMIFPGFPVFSQNHLAANSNNNSTVSSNATVNSTPSPDKSECKVTSTVNLPSSSLGRPEKGKSSRRPVSSSVAMETDNEALIKPEVDIVETVCHWDDCSKQFLTQNDLVGHVDRHVKAQKEHVCKWRDCSRDKKPFKASYMLVVHMRHHTGEKPHKCTYENCTKAYGRLENLKTHLRSHSGEKPYHCEIVGCTKAFSNASDRAKHQNRTHSNEKPYACTLQGCSKRYTDPSSLRKHIKTVHGIEAYNNKRRKRCDSDHGNQNDDNGRDGCLSSDRSPSNDETGSRNDPLGSVQSGNVDSPGTFSNPTDDFCTSVSPQANDSGVEMNVASDSLSCIMESVYSSAEMEAELSEAAVNAVISADGNEEHWQNERPNRMRQRIATKPTLPTISSGIPYESERRIADYMASRQPSVPVVSLGNARNSTSCANSGQQPNRPPNVNYLLKTTPTRRESASSLASSLYGSMKSISDATSYPAFSDCSRPNSVISTASTRSATIDKSPLLSNIGNQQQQQQHRPVAYYNSSRRDAAYQSSNDDSFDADYTRQYEPRQYVGRPPIPMESALSACRYQTGDVIVDNRQHQQQPQWHCCRYNNNNNATVLSSPVNQQRPASMCSNRETVSPYHLTPGGAASKRSSFCRCENSQRYSTEPSTSNNGARPLLCNGSSCENYQPPSIDNGLCDRFTNYAETPSPMNGCNCRQVAANNNPCVCCFKERPAIVNNNSNNNHSSCREFEKPFCTRRSSASVHNVEPADYDMHRLGASILNRSLVALPTNRPQINAHRVDIPLIAVASASSVRQQTNASIEPELDFSVLTLRPPELVPVCSSPVDNVTDVVPLERPPTVMERRMLQTQHIYQPTNLAATDMASNLMSYLHENQLYQSIMQKQFYQ